MIEPSDLAAQSSILMAQYITKRLAYMLLTLFVISIISFVIIQLPPGDYITTYIMSMKQAGTSVSMGEADALRMRYGLDQPMYAQYFKWIANFVQGDMGRSFQWNKEVNEIIWDRLGLTVLIALLSLIFTWIVSFAIGIYSAVKQYSWGDYFFSLLSFIGMSVPSFIFALFLMFIGFKYFDMNVGGLFSAAYEHAPWSMGKFLDLLAHLWIPIVVLGAGGTAGTVRIMRANLLDELSKPYVVAAKAKGLPTWKVILKYPVRIALNPFISTVGWVLPGLISGSEITSIVLNIPTTGPILLSALMAQDMYLAASFIMMLSVLTVIGTVISDLLLVIIDPRIRYE